MALKDWFIPIPVYVTRKTAGSNSTGYFSLAAWIAIPTFYIVALNILLWGGIGIWKAIEVIS
jgi:hypothetical protein